MTDYPGIDYGLGMSNIDTETGIRYGVINMNALCEFAWDSFEPMYAKACPHCGDELDDDFEGPNVCDCCSELVEEGEEWCAEPYGWEYMGIEEDGYELQLGTDNDLFVLKSPWVTNAQFCSPCAPGAGHLENPCADGPVTYALGPEWFEGEKCPYPVRKL